MCWPRTPHCGASFRDLFSNDWSIVDVEAKDVATHNRRTFPAMGPVPDLRKSSVDDLHVTSGAWLFPMGESESFVPLVRRCGELFDELQPTPEIRSIVDDFALKHFRSRMIGVHVRRGDFATVHPGIGDSLQEAIAAVDRCLQQQPDAGVLLCTDDGAVWPSRDVAPNLGTVEQFAAKYGDRLVRFAPRSLNREESVAVADSLVELLLLRRTSMFVGTSGSGFSDFAIYQRDVPYELVASAAKDAAVNGGRSRIGRRVVRLLRRVVRRPSR